MESPLIELTRSLYHLDYFRRNFRKLAWHQCEASSVTGADCLVCCFKNLFHELSLLMKETVLDPPHIRQTIESSIENARIGKFKSIGSVPGSVSAHMQFESLLRQLEDSSVLPGGVEQCVIDGLNAAAAGSGSGPTLKLHTEFSYTKICLQCRTTSYIENVTQYVMQIDATNFVSDDWPSFEFAIKTSLDSGEFCVQPNCYGQTKVFRLLRTLPHFLPIYFSDGDATAISLISLIPTKLRPHLIFESSTSVADLILKGVILYSPQWGYATIFHHSRLDLWVFIDSRRVLTLCKTWIESRFHPITHGFTVVFCFYCKDDITTSHYLPPPQVPTKCSMIGANYVKPQSEYDSSRIYENWPLDTDSGQGSEGSSTNSSVSCNMKSPNRDSFYSSSTKEETGSRRNSPTKSPSILSAEGRDLGKFATVRRKVKYHGKGKYHEKGNMCSLSLSAPDLRVLVPPAPCPPTTQLPVALSPLSPTRSIFSTGGTDRSSICSSNKDGSSVSTGKKVSFNCEVTLVDDPDDTEYIPHPIFESVLKMMKHDTFSMKHNGSSSSSNGSSC